MDKDAARLPIYVTTTGYIKRNHMKQGRFHPFVPPLGSRGTNLNSNVAMDVVPLRMSPKEGSLWWESVEHDVDFEAQAQHGPKMVHRRCSTYSGDGAGE